MKIKFLLFLIVSMFLFTACTPKTEETTAYHKITVQEAKEKIDAGDVTIVDVRTAEEYQESHIENAILIPNESIGSQKPEQLPDTEAVILVYCRSGRRSKEASEKLVELGYKNIYDFGGIIDWSYETVAEEE